MKGASTAKSHQVVVMMGSNLGDRMSYLTSGAIAIQQYLGRIVKRSSVYETAAWGKSSGKAYLNQLLVVQTEVAPLDFMEGLLQIEKQFGRERNPKEHYSDRTLDLDVIYIDDLILNHTQLQVPHPRMAQRNFVLIPLVEVLPTYVHPELGKSSEAMLQDSPDNSFVKKVDEKIK